MVVIVAILLTVVGECIASKARLFLIHSCTFYTNDKFGYLKRVMQCILIHETLFNY